MCKVCLTASITRVWRVRFLLCCLSKLAEHIFLNSQYNLLAGFSANLRTRKLRLMSSLYKDTRILSVRGASSLITIAIKSILSPRFLATSSFNVAILTLDSRETPYSGPFCEEKLRPGVEGAISSIHKVWNEANLIL